MLKERMLGCCKIYISESRNKTAIETLDRTAKQFPHSPIINKFQDSTYNRVGYTLVSTLPPPPHLATCPLIPAAFGLVKAAFDNIDIVAHCGSHPRLGVVDHLCFHPLASSSLEHVASLAKTLAFDVASLLQVPTYLYGAAHEEQRTLDSIRRELGYFKPNSGTQWSGTPISETLPLPPDYPGQVSPSKGVVVIGATRWVDNYNVPVLTDDIVAVRRIAKRVSGRGGGLTSVQAMALAHGDGVVEVACNLLEPSNVGGNKVQKEVEKLAKEQGLIAEHGYFTDFPQEKVIERYLSCVPTLE